MFRPDGERRSFSVVRDMTVIGRREDCDLRIPLGDVSRKHCRLIKDADSSGLRVEDLGSSNGTYRNGNRVQQSELTAGDTLQVGPVVFVLQVDGTPSDEELQPVVAAGATGGGAGGEAGAGAEEELEVIGESGEAKESDSKEFDPMEALNAAEGSGFEFHMEEEAAAAAAARAGGEDDAGDIIDMGDSAAHLEEAPEDAPVEPEPQADAPAELDAMSGADEVIDLEESEEKK